MELIKNKKEKENSKSDKHVKEIETEREKKKEELKSELWATVRHERWGCLKGIIGPHSHEFLKTKLGA